MEIVFIFMSLIVQCYSLEITLKIFNKYNYKFYSKDEIGVNDVKSMRNVINKLPAYNYIDIKYNENDVRIDRLEDLPFLEYIWMEKNNLRTIPSLRNIPKLLSVDFTKNRINKLEKSMFGETNVSSIFLTHNDISEIEEGSFGPNVCWLQLACNSLTEFSPNWFTYPAKIQILNLGGNNIQYVKSTYFEKFTSMYDLHLSYNDLKQIDSGSLTFSKHFTFLHLQNNDLRNLDSNIFQPSTSIDNLNLHYNNLSFLPEKLLTSIQVRHSINLVGNPWKCKCIEKTENWIFRSWPKGVLRSRNSSEPYCVNSYENECVESVESDELIEKFDKSIQIPIKKEDYCINYSTVQFNPCKECHIC